MSKSADKFRGFDYVTICQKSEFVPLEIISRNSLFPIQKWDFHDNRYLFIIGFSKKWLDDFLQEMWKFNIFSNSNSQSLKCTVAYYQGLENHFLLIFLVLSWNRLIL